MHSSIVEKVAISPKSVKNDYLTPRRGIRVDRGWESEIWRRGNEQTVQIGFKATKDKRQGKQC